MKTPDTELHLVDLLYDDELTPEVFEQRLAALEHDPEALAQLKAWGAVQQAMLSLPEPDPDPQVHYDILRAARAAATPARRGFWETLAAWSLSPVAAGLGLLVLAGSMLTLFSQQDEAPAQFDESPVARSEKTSADETRQVAPQSAATPRGAVAASAVASTAPPVVQARRAAAPGSVPSAAPKTLDARRPAAQAEPDLDGLAKGVATKGGTSKAAEMPAQKYKKARRAKRKPAKRKSRGKAPSPKKPMADILFDDALGGDTKGAEPSPATARGDGYAPPPPPAPRGGAPVEAEEAKASKDDRAVAQDREAPARVQEDDDLADDASEGLAIAGAVTRSPAPAPAAEPVAPVVDAPTVDAPAPTAQPAAASARPVRRRSSNSVATGSGEAQGDLAAITPSDASTTLAQARAARSAGRLRDAARAYDDFGRRFRQHGSFAQAMFEAAQTYEGLGDNTRAVQLYRLVVSAGGANAGAAQVRLNQLSPPAQKAGQAPPVTRE
jgi:hypothetical protein